MATVNKRTKEGGINILEIGLDETYSGKAEYFLTEILWRIYADHKSPLTEFELPAWQTGMQRACAGLKIEAEIRDDQHGHEAGIARP